MVKVKDLLEELRGLPEDANISIQLDSGCCGDVEYLEINTIDSYAPSKHYEGSINIRCNSLPGYESCISAGRMSKLAKQIQEEREERKKKT